MVSTNGVFPGLSPAIHQVVSGPWARMIPIWGPPSVIGSSFLSRMAPLDMVNWPVPRLLYTWVAMALIPRRMVFDDPSDMVSIRRLNSCQVLGGPVQLGEKLYDPPDCTVFSPDPITSALAA